MISVTLISMIKLVKVRPSVIDSGEFTVSYNGYTLPGEINIVILEWQDDNIMSPSRPGNNIPAEVLEAGAKYRPLVLSQPQNRKGGEVWFVRPGC